MEEVDVAIIAIASGALGAVAANALAYYIERLRFREKRHQARYDYIIQTLKSLIEDWTLYQEMLYQSQEPDRVRHDMIIAHAKALLLSINQSDFDKKTASNESDNLGDVANRFRFLVSTENVPGIIHDNRKEFVNAIERIGKIVKIINEQS